MDFMQATVTNRDAAVVTRVVTCSFNSDIANMWPRLSYNFKEKYTRVEEEKGTMKSVPLVLLTCSEF